MQRDFIVFIIGVLSGMGLGATYYHSLKSHISNEILKVRTDINYVLSGGKIPLVTHPTTAPQPIEQHKS
jgi:hypothetical protein